MDTNASQNHYQTRYYQDENGVIFKFFVGLNTYIPNMYRLIDEGEIGQINEKESTNDTQTNG